MRKILFLCLFAFCAMIAKAQYPIGTQTITVNDASRSRNIQAYFYYPGVSAGSGVAVATPPAGGWPVVVVGHGFSMDYSAFTNFKDSLVPKGYIVIIPNSETGLIPAPNHAAFGLDLAYMITYIKAQNLLSSSVYYNKVSSKAAIIGHSMGGGCTYLGAQSNPNVTTTVTFSAAETNVSAITAAKSVNCPSLVFAGQNDCVAPLNTNQQKMYDSLAASCKTLLIVKNGGHCQYSNSNFNCDFGEGTCRGTSTVLTRAQEQPIVFSFLYKWLGFYLKGDCSQWPLFQNQVVTDSRVLYQQRCDYNLPVSSIFNAGRSVFCNYDSTRLYSGTGFTSYLWSNGVPDSSITARTGGSYSLIVTDQYGCKDTSNIINLTVNTPIRSIIYPGGPINMCGSDSFPLAATGILSSFNWNTGDTVSSIQVYTAGEYFLQTIDANGCKAWSDTAHLRNTSPIRATLTPPDTITICEGEDVVFNVGNAYSLVNWSDGGSGSVHAVRLPNTYYANLTDTNGCNSITDSVEVEVLAVPVPVVLHNLDSLEGPTGYTHYEWRDTLGNVLDTNRIFVPSTEDYFVLYVTNDQGCQGSATAVQFLRSRPSNIVSPLYVNSFRVYPNPSGDYVNIENLSADYCHFRIMNLLGTEVRSGLLSAGVHRLAVDTLPTGQYLLELNNDRVKITKKLIINH